MNSAARAFGTLVGIALTAGFIAAGPSGGAGTAVAPGPSRTPDQGSVLPDQIEPGTETTVVHGPDVSGPAKDTVQRGQPAENPATAAAMCAAGRNTGPSAPGVTANKIRLASTAVLDGPAASLLSSSPTAMQAVINKVNRAGGVCGRQLELTVVNDGFNAQRGSDFIRNFIDEKYFALPVVPSAEGLSAAIAAKSISRAGIPVVGTDGMRLEQYDEPWVWPVATATASTMRIMARYGYEKVGARTFAIVWDDKYQFGIEGADAFRAEVQRLGGTVVAPIRLNPDLPSYGSDADNFNHLCANGKCDMVALLLLPDTAR
ncbi:MAG: hypothetical protein QOI20_1210, partial [Acidimicrobiaceae bacterium]|nr:hypothetical protein [Acidimicrobiaceae bacterium]